MTRLLADAVAPDRTGARLALSAVSGALLVAVVAFVLIVGPAVGQ